jgi:hypothetical protein
MNEFIDRRKRGLLWESIKRFMTLLRKQGH